MPEFQLPPIKEDGADYEALEKALLKHFRDEIYLPLVKEIKAPATVLKNEMIHNSPDDVIRALKSGRIYFERGIFKGKFSAAVSKELKALGATFDRAEKGYRISMTNLPFDVRTAVIVSDQNLTKTFDRINTKLQQLSPEKIADSLDVSKFFDTTLLKLDSKLMKTMKGLTVAPEFTKEQRAKIADEYSNNMKLFIKDWTEKEIKKLRKQVEENAIKGKRYENLVKDIQSSYGVSQNKAKFLARQETSLIMTKFKETRYTSAGVDEYIWGCVAGSKNHPVRPWHKKLEGKKFRWDDPPITTEPGQPVRRNNPGQDFNCRCFAKPVVKF